MAITALVLGLVGLFFLIFGVTAPVSIFLGVLGLIFGLIAVSKLRNRASSKGVAWSGLAVSLLALVLGTVVSVSVFSAINHAFPTGMSREPCKRRVDHDRPL